MRFLPLLVLLASCQPPPAVVVQVGTPDVGISTALKHTVLMEEGCTAVAVGKGLMVTAAHCVDKYMLGTDTSIGYLVYDGSMVVPERDFAITFDTSRLDDPKAELRKPVFGEHVFALGYPMQLATDTQELTVTDGLVAGPIDDDGQWRFTAPIYFGSSGGGVWGSDGCLVGISVSGYMKMQGMYYMVPASDIQPKLPR